MSGRGRALGKESQSFGTSLGKSVGLRRRGMGYRSAKEISRYRGKGYRGHNKISRCRGMGSRSGLCGNLFSKRNGNGSQVVSVFTERKRKSQKHGNSRKRNGKFFLLDYFKIPKFKRFFIALKVQVFWKFRGQK